MCKDTVLGPGRWSSCYLPTLFLDSVAVPLMTARVLNVLTSLRRNCFVVSESHTPTVNQCLNSLTSSPTVAILAVVKIQAS